MDYSQLPNDPDHPAGTSPWQTSPGLNRANFPQEADSAPSSPIPAKQQSSIPDSGHESLQRDQENTSEPAAPSRPLPPEESPSQPNGVGKQPTRSISYSRSDIRFQGPPMTEEELRQEQIRQQRTQERYQQALHAQQHQRTTGPNRYHQPGQRNPRQPPAYKLQAKIIALERVGKKDPAIRFDVHVSSARSIAELDF